jgi:hypothetical protein
MSADFMFMQQACSGLAGEWLKIKPQINSRQYRK